MSELFNRDIRVVAGPLVISPRTAVGFDQTMLALKFDITKSQAREPNKCSMTIWNLSEANRTKLQEEGLEVIIEAGYVDEIVQIFKGDIDRTTITRESTDWITEVELLDGGRKRATSRMNLSFRGGQSVAQMLKKAAEQMGVGLGNLGEQITSGGGRSVLKEFVSGFIFSGKTDDLLDELSSSMGLKYSVQDGNLQFLGKGRALSGPAVVLDLLSGLIGSPSIGEKGVVKAKSLLNGRIKPGVRVALASLVVSGDFIADKVKHTGATWGSEWTTDMELLPL